VPVSRRNVLGSAAALSLTTVLSVASAHNQPLLRDGSSSVVIYRIRSSRPVFEASLRLVAPRNVFRTVGPQRRPIPRYDFAST
jgi:hypothetical protein